MSASEISIDIDQLMSDVILINDAKLAEIDAAMQASCNTVATLTLSGWEGEAKDTFMEQFTEFKQEMRKFYENLSAFNEALKAIHADGEAVYQEGAALSAALG
jgi:WXG100 family type VII secretion target